MFGTKQSVIKLAVVMLLFLLMAACGRKIAIATYDNTNTSDARIGKLEFVDKQNFKMYLKDGRLFEGTYEKSVGGYQLNIVSTTGNPNTSLPVTIIDKKLKTEDGLFERRKTPKEENEIIFSIVNDTDSSFENAKLMATNRTLNIPINLSSRGHSQKIYMPTGANNRFDIQLVDNQNVYFTKWQVEISDESTITFTMSDRNKYVTFEGENGRISFRNYGSEAWYDIGERQNEALVYQILRPSPNNYYDFRLVDRQSLIYYKSNIGITEDTTVLFERSDRNTMISVDGNRNGDISIRHHGTAAWTAVGKKESAYLNYQIANPSPDSLYDIRLIEAARGSWGSTVNVFYTKYGIKITQDQAVTFVDRDKDPYVTITNDTGNSVNAYYRRPAGSTSWGSNRLTGNPLGGWYSRSTSPGQFQSDESIEHKYDFRLDDEIGNVYLRLNVSITNDVNLSFTTTHRIPRFLVRNSTGLKASIAIANHGSNDWKVHIAEAASTTENRHYSVVPMHHNIFNPDNRYDIRLIDTSGNVYLSSNQHLVSSDITLSYRAEDRVSKRYTIRNNSEMRLVSGQIRSSGSTDWRPLTMPHIPNGESIYLTSHNQNIPLDSAQRYDIRFVDSLDYTYLKSNLVLANDITLTITESDRQ